MVIVTVCAKEAAECRAVAAWGEHGLWRGLDSAGKMGTLPGTLQPLQGGVQP